MLPRMKLPSPFLSLLLAGAVVAQAEVIETDIVIFGASSGGIAAAVQAKRMGKSVVIAEWTPHFGGLTTGGLGATDIGNKGAIGGIAREFYEQIHQHYADAANWKWHFRRARAFRSGCATR
jgi:ribulose 1,5-bisphosphate synthetase/thiazole synthase